MRSIKERLILIESKLETQGKLLYGILLLIGANLGIPLIPMAAAILA